MEHPSPSHGMWIWENTTPNPLCVVRTAADHFSCAVFQWKYRGSPFPALLRAAMPGHEWRAHCPMWGLRPLCASTQFKQPEKECWYSQNCRRALERLGKILKDGTRAPHSEEALLSMDRLGHAPSPQSRWKEKTLKNGSQPTPFPREFGERFSGTMSLRRRLWILHKDIGYKVSILARSREGGCLQHNHIWDGATLSGTVPSSSTYRRGISIGRCRIWKCFPSSWSTSRYAPCSSCDCCDSMCRLSLKKKFFLHQMLHYCLLRFSLSCFWSRTHHSSWKNCKILMKDICTVDVRRLESETLMFQKSWKEVPSYFDGF